MTANNLQSEMMEDNKVVIKINYVAGKHPTNNADVRPGVITQWNIKRIVIAVLLVVMMPGSLLYFLWNKNDAVIGIDTTHDQNITDTDTFSTGKQLKDASKTQHQSIITQQQGIVSGAQELNKQSGIKPQQLSGFLADDGVKPAQAVIDAGNHKQLKEVGLTEKKHPHMDVVEKPETVAAPGKQKFSAARGRLTRVQLAKGISGKEPLGEIVSPVVVGNDKATGVFYFTELRGMQGETIYHEWLRDGKVVFAKPIKILGKRWRASTSKLMNHSYTGNWTVRLKNSHGQVLNEINFVVRKSSQ